MNLEFKVLTNVNPSNLKSPIIQNRFRKLTLQSPVNTNTKSPRRYDNLEPKDALEENVNPTGAANNESHMAITNKLMLSSSSSDISNEHIHFINVETEPFSRPLRLSNTEKENESPQNFVTNQKNNDLVTIMENLDMSQKSIDMFSQDLESSSVPRNRVVSNDDNNIENISQRISSIHVSDDFLERRRLIDGVQPNTSQRLDTQLHQSLAETQPNTPRKIETQPNGSPISIPSDSEDEDIVKQINKSLLTEETEDDDSVIEVESSDDNDGIASLKDRLPEVPEINTRTSESREHILDRLLELPQVNSGNLEASEILEQKMKRYFDKMPTSNFESILSHNTSDNDSTEISVVHSEMNVSETSASDNVSENFQQEASRLNESLDKSNNIENSSSLKISSEVEPLQDVHYNTNDTFNTHSDKSNELLPSHASIKKGDKTVATASEHQTSQIEHNSNNNCNSSHEGLDRSECSNIETPRNFSSEVIKKSGSSVFTINSPRINITAKININIQLSVSASSSEGDCSTANSSSSKEESENNTTSSIEEAIHSSSREENAVQYEKAETSARIGELHLKKIYIDSPKDKEIEHTDDIHEKSVEISQESTSNKSSLIHTENVCFGDVPDVKNSPTILCGVEQKRDSLVDVYSTPNERAVLISPMDVSGEIDEIGEKILDDVYGETWRTPQLIKKCLSTKKKCFTDVAGRNRSRGFSLFQRDIPSELESTRIGHALLNDEDNIGKRLDESPQTFRDSSTTADRTDTENNGNHSSRILRGCRKAPANRIVDSSSDENDSDRDDSFQPDDESDSSFEKIDEPKSTSRKKNGMIYLDLTCVEVIEDEGHYEPDASAEDLEKVSNKFIKSLESSNNVQTPVPTNKFVPSIPAKRKLFTPNYDDLPPLEETKTPVSSPKNINDKVVKLKTPIPTFLIPPKFRGGELATIDKVPTTPKLTRICGFLESLDDKKIPDKYCDPDAQKIRSNFKKNRHELVDRLMKLFDDKVFGNKLKDVTVSWSKTLTKTAGICRTRRIGNIRKASVELSEKVLTTADRVRDTLIHELCHAAAWLFDGFLGHGAVWKLWTQKATKCLPELPEIERCHNYDIDYKYTYKCSVCGLRSQAHTKSKKVEKALCAMCHGPIEVFLNQKDKDGKIILVAPKEACGFAKFVKENYKLFKETGGTHALVMKMLSNNFAKLTVQEKLKYKN